MEVTAMEGLRGGEEGLQCTQVDICTGVWRLSVSSTTSISQKLLDELNQNCWNSVPVQWLQTFNETRDGVWKGKENLPVEAEEMNLNH